jgi:hypothetical protein
VPLARRCETAEYTGIYSEFLCVLRVLCGERIPLLIHLATLFDLHVLYNLLWQLGQMTWGKIALLNSKINR